MKPPPIQYADGPEGRVAYQVLGDGPVDLLFVPFPGRNNLDIIWEMPALERYLRRLASFSRLILSNVRGTGLSDPIPREWTLTPEDCAIDLRCVLDAVGSRRAGCLAIEGAGAFAMFFAAAFPERTLSLALIDGYATLGKYDDNPWGMPPDALDRFADSFKLNWGTGGTLDYMSPELARDERFRDWFARIERLSMSQAVVGNARVNMLAWDVRGVLSSIQAPTLVVSHTEVPWIRIGHGRNLAERIPNARYVERPGFWGGVYWIQDAEWTLDEVQAFFTGTRGTPDLDDRVLATVLFTDIVASTEHASAIGDHRWRALLDEHDALVRQEIERFRGRVVKSTGDGILATFDGPARAIRCGIALREAVRSVGVDIRMGLHTGEVELRGEDVAGIAVVIGARVMAEAAAGEVLVSSSVPPLVAGSGIEFEDRGTRKLKGVPGEWRVYAVKP